MPRKGSYDDTFAEEERKALEGIRLSRTKTQLERYKSDLTVVQSLRRRHAMGEFPIRRRPQED